MKMTFKQKQIVYMGIIALALTAATTGIVKAETPKNADIAFCQQYKTYADQQRKKGNRWEYTTAKRMFMACLNTAHQKRQDKGIKKDIGDFMSLHEQNDANNATVAPAIPKELQGRY